jgi:hypothetical protein
MIQYFTKLKAKQKPSPRGATLDIFTISKNKQIEWSKQIFNKMALDRSPDPSNSSKQYFRQRSILTKIDDNSVKNVTIKVLTSFFHIWAV